MTTHISTAQADGFRIHAIWDSAEALAHADWMHELIKSGVAADALAGEVAAR